MHPDLLQKNCEEMIEDMSMYIAERTPTYQEAITALSSVLVNAALRVDISKESFIGYVSDLYDAFEQLMEQS